MNAHAGSFKSIAERNLDTDEFCLLRSEMLDCFADIEQTLTSYVFKNTQKGFCSTAPLSQKVEVAKKVPAGPRRSKKLKSEADAELEKLAILLPRRAAMVHSRMELAFTSSNQCVAIFKNAKNVSTDNVEASVLNKQEFRAFIEKLSDLNSSLIVALNAQNEAPNPKTLNPASSPPQPKQAAATGL